MKRAIVTFIIDENEFLYPPVFDFAGVDFLCFTDVKGIESLFWKICPLNGLLIEEIKNAPEKYLSEYEWIEFIDAGEIVTMGTDGGIKVVRRPDLSVCVDAGYLTEVQNATIKVRQMAADTTETCLKTDADEKVEYPYKLTIGMLVGRKSPYFDNCFSSILRIMEAIPESELIIVDTGNEDGSVDKVRKVAEERENITIVPFTWVHDFSATRNEAIKRARGLWYMTLDDDEWFDDISALVGFFEADRELYKKYDYAMYTQRNYLDEEGMAYDDVSVVRLAKNRPDLRYRRRIHENFNFKEKEIDPYAIDSYVHHYGYLNNLESRKAKSQRNMALLSIENEENPTDSHVIAQIIQEMMFTERYELAYIYALRGLSVQRIAPDHHIGLFVTMLVKVLRVIDKDELWNYEKRYIKNTELSYIESAYVTYQFATTAYEVANADKAIEYSSYFATAYYDYNRAPIDVQLAVAATICDNFCNKESYLSDMLIIRALSYELKRDNKSVVATLKKINPTKINRYPMDYYSLLVRYDIATPDFYHNNTDTPGIWMLFVQALLQKSVLCASLLKCIATPALDMLINDAQRYISPAQKSAFEQIFEGLVVLRLVCEYMQAGDYNMALNAVKIALQGSEQARAVALILFDELKKLIS